MHDNVRTQWKKEDLGGLIGGVIGGALGTMVGIWADKWDQQQGIDNFVVLPLTFLSGTFYSINLLPEFWRKLSSINPFFYNIDGFRFAFTGYSDASVIYGGCLLYTSPSPRDATLSRMPSSA